MKLKLWGVRGSVPSPLLPERLRRQTEELILQFEKLKEQGLSARNFIDTLPAHSMGGYGGNTMCAEIKSKTSRLLIDGGSGLRAFSDLVMRTEPTTADFHVYFTHFHWDHLLGLPFFVPLYMKGRVVNIYSIEDGEAMMRALFKKPYFPVPYEVIQPQLRFHRLEPRKPFQVGDLTATPYKLDHPDPCWGLRVEGGGKAISWSVDNECTRTTQEELGEDVALYTKSDLLIFDAQYSFGEALEKINWGHASGPIGLDLAIREQVARVVFIHHDPAASDAEIREAEQQTVEYFEEITKVMKRSGREIPDLMWHFGREGEEFDVGGAGHGV